jgi:hypothetical protein
VTSDGAPPLRAAKSYVNFRKADWVAYVCESEAELRSLPLPSSCGAGERVFRDILLRAAKHAIPASYRQDFVPGMTQEAAELIHERDELRSADPRDPGIAVKVMGSSSWTLQEEDSCPQQPTHLL